MEKEVGKVVEEDSVLFVEKRMAALDGNHYAFVTNKAFTDYFGASRGDNIIGFVHPDEVDKLNEFLDTYDGEKKSEIFRFKNAANQYRYNLLILLKENKNCKHDVIDIQMVDIEEAEAVNEKFANRISRLRALLGITEEYVFTYTRETNQFCLYRYEISSREVLFRMDLDAWKKEMLKNDYIDDKDVPKFISMCGDMKAYSHSFSAKINAGIRTRNQIKEKLRFDGILYHGVDEEKMIIGRIMVAESSSQKRAVELIDGLTYDSLTHVYNKKTITEYAKKIIAEEKNNKITLVILDVDHFKQVNDTYGHLYGDKVLERVGEKLKEIVGDDGTVGRIGGDEFMIVLNGVNDDQLLRGMLRAIRTQIKWEFVGDFDDLTITCSIGAAICPDNGSDYEELFKKADYCLYIAKEKGRDRYVFFRDEMHQKAYEESVNRIKTTTSNGREMNELRFMAEAMSHFCDDQRGVIESMMNHMLETYRLDSISIYSGDEFRRTQTVGTVLQYSEDAKYVCSEEFKKLLGNKNYIQLGFVGNCSNEAPEFYLVMKQRRIFSTIQCLIGTKDNIKGVLTLDKCKESAQWAEYEVECAIMLASLLSVYMKSDE